MPGYTKCDNPILERVLTSNLTKRQLKILLLVIRFSAGCQKRYAVLRRNDYAYAGISPSCAANELEKLVRLRVLRWDAGRDLVWLNPDLRQWAVDRPGENLGDDLRQFFKIATKNLPKWQEKVAKTSSFQGGLKEKKENIKDNNNYRFLRILTDYFLRVVPLSQKEASMLREVVRSHNPRLVEEAIAETASGNDRTFASFLKALDQAAERARPVRRMSGMESVGLALARRKRRTPVP